MGGRELHGFGWARLRKSEAMSIDPKHKCPPSFREACPSRQDGRLLNPVNNLRPPSAPPRHGRRTTHGREAARAHVAQPGEDALGRLGRRSCSSGERGRRRGGGGGDELQPRLVVALAGGPLELARGADASDELDGGGLDGALQRGAAVEVEDERAVGAGHADVDDGAESLKVSAELGVLAVGGDAVDHH